MIEASLILPMCLTLCMVMAGTFRFLQLEESLYYSGFLQMRQCSTDMSLDASSAKISRLYLEHRIIERSRREMGAEQKHWIELMGIAEEGMFFRRKNGINSRRSVVASIAGGLWEMIRNRDISRMRSDLQAEYGEERTVFPYGSSPTGESVIIRDPAISPVEQKYAR